MNLFNGIYTIFKKSLGLEIEKQNLFNASPQLSQKQLQQQQLQMQLQHKKLEISPSLNTYLVTKFFDISKTKQELLKEIDELRDFYFSQLIVNRIIEDALTPAIDQDFFKVIVKDKEGNKDNSITPLLEELNEQLNIKRVLLDVSSDLLFYGEYFLRLDISTYSDKTDFINIHDDVDMTKIIPVYRDSDISYYLKYDIDENIIKEVDPSNFIYFYLPSNRIRVKVNSIDDKVLYIRMGQSILYPVFGLLKELMFLEKLMPVAMVKKLQAMKIVGVSIPNNTPASEALDIARVYQKMIDKAMMTNANYNNIDELLKIIQTRFGSIKIIPVWNEKGELQTQDVENDEDLSELQDKINDIREMIMRTIGLPVNLITQDTDITKADVIKSYSMYVKKLKSLQQSLAEGLKQLYVIYLKNQGFTEYTKKDIEIVWTNTINYEELQKIELFDVMVSSFENIKNFVDDMESKDYIDVNKKDFVEYVNKNLKDILGYNLFEYKEESENKEDSW